MSDTAFQPQITFRLSREDRDLLVGNEIALDPELANPLRLGVLEGGRVAFTVPVRVLDGLVETLAAEADLAPSRHLRRRLSRIHDHLAPILDAYQASVQDPNAVPLTGPLAPYQREMIEAIKGLPGNDLDLINRKLKEFTDERNRRSVADFDGLSPIQVGNLMYSEWGPSGTAVMLNPQLPPAAVQAAEFLSNARIFLRALKDGGGAKATATGNLNRKFVREMLDAMTWPPNYREDYLSWRQTWNEQEVLPLHTIRIVLIVAGLIREFKNKFAITQEGERLLAEEAAGELYVRLFHAYFHEFNMACADHFVECPGLQQSLGYTLFMLGRHAKRWTLIGTLAAKILLPAVAAEIPAGPYGLDYESMAVNVRILHPLARFGLVEYQAGEKGVLTAPWEKKVRKTPLYDTFLRFNPDCD